MIEEADSPTIFLPRENFSQFLNSYNKYALISKMVAQLTRRRQVGYLVQTIDHGWKTFDRFGISQGCCAGRYISAKNSTGKRKE